MLAYGLKKQICLGRFCCYCNNGSNHDAKTGVPYMQKQLNQYIDGLRDFI